MQITGIPSDYLEEGLKIKLKEATANLINSASIIKKVPKETTILRQGEMPTHLCYIVKGITRGYYIDSDGNDITKCFESDNGFVCSEGLRKEGTARFSIESLVDCICILIQYSAIYQILKEDQDVRQIFEDYNRKVICYYEKREQQLLTMKAMDQYLNFKQAFGHIESKIPLAHIASYIGVRPSSLSRLRRSCK